MNLLVFRGRNTDTARYLTFYVRHITVGEKEMDIGFQLDNPIRILIILFIKKINQVYTDEYGRM